MQEYCPDIRLSSLYAFGFVDGIRALISALTRLDPIRASFAKNVCIVGGIYGPHGLLICIARHIRTVRWAVIREGMILPQDLIDSDRENTLGK